MHTFIPSMRAPECDLCHRTEQFHKLPKCDECDILSHEVEYIRGRILCAMCDKKLQLQILDAVSREAEKLSSVNYNGDYFNLKMASIIELKHAIDADDSIPKEQKEYEWHNAIVKRYTTLKDKIFKLSNELHDSSVEILAINSTLRQFGSALRAELREEIRKADQAYQPEPPKKQIRTRISSTKKTPFEKLCESYALMKGISVTAAKLELEGKVKK